MKELIFKYKLTNLRILMILFSCISILLSLSDNVTYETEAFYLVTDFDTLIRSFLFCLGVFGLLISIILFEYIQFRPLLYLPLGIINILIGILFTKAIWCVVTMKEFILNSSLLKIKTIPLMSQQINYIKQYLRNNFNYEIDKNKIKQILVKNNYTYEELETLSNQLNKKKELEEKILLLNQQKQQLEQEKTSLMNYLPELTFGKIMGITFLILILCGIGYFYFFGSFNKLKTATEHIKKVGDDAIGGLEQQQEMIKTLNTHVGKNNDIIETLI
jgi:hypothetical protein